eukprot:Gb_29203 [translate_table: standard]
MEDYEKVKKWFSGILREAGINLYSSLAYDVLSGSFNGIEEIENGLRDETLQFHEVFKWTPGMGSGIYHIRLKLDKAIEAMQHVTPKHKEGMKKKVTDDQVTKWWNSRP